MSCIFLTWKHVSQNVRNMGLISGRNCQKYTIGYYFFPNSLYNFFEMYKKVYFRNATDSIFRYDITVISITFVQDSNKHII